MSPDGASVFDHDLDLVAQQIADRLHSDLTRIRIQGDDPGTKGDEGELAWADGLRELLPPSYVVLTKGRLVSATGTRSKQTDLVVLRPGYPAGMARRRAHLADGVALVLECKLALDPNDLRSEPSRVAKIKELPERTLGSPRRELYRNPMCGLVALGMARGTKNDAEAARSISAVLAEVLDASDDPRMLPELVCVPRIGCWQLVRLFTPSKVQFGYATGSTDDRRAASALLALQAAIWARLSHEDAGMQSLAKYLDLRHWMGGALVGTTVKEFELDRIFSGPVLGAIRKATLHRGIYPTRGQPSGLYSAEEAAAEAWMPDPEEWRN